MRFFLSICIVALLLAGGEAHALSPTPLPAIELVDAAGGRIAANRIGKEASVLLVLVKRNSQGGDTMLTYLSSRDPAIPTGRLHIVVSGADEKLLRTMRERFKELSNAAWYRDPSEALIAQLDIKATPVVIGVRNAMAGWTIIGTAGGKKMEAMLRDWLQP